MITINNDGEIEKYKVLTPNELKEYFLNKYDENTTENVLRTAKTLHSLVEKEKAIAILYLNSNEVRFQGK